MKHRSQKDSNYKETMERILIIISITKLKKQTSTNWIVLVKDSQLLYKQWNKMKKAMKIVIQKQQGIKQKINRRKQNKRKYWRKKKMTLITAKY